MKKQIFILVLFMNMILISVSVHAKEKIYDGKIQSVNYIRLDINIDGTPYKLSNTVKVYYLGGNKFLAVKKLEPNMIIEFKYSTKRGVKTISEIWRSDL